MCEVISPHQHNTYDELHKIRHRRDPLLSSQGRHNLHAQGDKQQVEQILQEICGLAKRCTDKNLPPNKKPIVVLEKAGKHTEEIFLLYSFRRRSGMTSN